MHSLAQTLTRIVAPSRHVLGLHILCFQSQDMAKRSISSNVRINNVA